MSPVDGFLSSGKWFFPKVWFSHLQNGHHIIAITDSLVSGLRGGDFCAGGKCRVSWRPPVGRRAQEADSLSGDLHCFGREL